MNNDLGGGNAITPQHLAWSQYLTSQPQSPFQQLSQAQSSASGDMWNQYWRKLFGLQGGDPSQSSGDPTAGNQLAQANPNPNPGSGGPFHIIVDKDGNIIGYTNQAQPEIRIDPETGKVTIHPPKPLKPFDG